MMKNKLFSLLKGIGKWIIFAMIWFNVAIFTGLIDEDASFVIVLVGIFIVPIVGLVALILFFSNARNENHNNLKYSQQESKSETTPPIIVTEETVAQKNEMQKDAEIEQPKPKEPTPEEIMEAVDNMEGHVFEHFIADILRNVGYYNVQVTPGSGDYGVDILAEMNGVRYAFQCKCYSSPLGLKPIQEVNAGKYHYKAHVGVVVTNSTFTPAAIEIAEDTGVLLWDRNKLIHEIALMSRMKSL